IRDKLVTGVQTCALPISQLFRPNEEGAVIFFRESTASAEWRFLMEANAAQKDRLAVQQDVCATSLNCAEADLVGDAIRVSRDDRSEERRVGKECRGRGGG